MFRLICELRLLYYRKFVSRHHVFYVKYLKNLYGQTFNWVQTSYNANIRKNYAGIGYTYDEDRDAFIPPQPYNSWTLNEDTCQWEAPSAYPDDGKRYNWNEETTSWKEVT